MARTHLEAFGWLSVSMDVRGAVNRLKAFKGLIDGKIGVGLDLRVAYDYYRRV
jgi:hypothetical protein